MSLEPHVWLYAVGSAILFVTGGAAWRTSSVLRARAQAEKLRAQQAETQEALMQAETSLQNAQRAELQAREALQQHANDEARQNEQLVLAVNETRSAKEEAARLHEELAVESNLVKQMETSLEAVRVALSSVQQELKETVAAAGRAEERARAAGVKAPATLVPMVSNLRTFAAPRPPQGLVGAPGGASDETTPDSAALAALRTEVHQFRQRLEMTTKERDAMGQERDAARAKVEALERLVEGVRARSRELTGELQRLKGKI